MASLLTINDIKADIDEETVIGINSQSYDITNPANKLVNTTNAFSIPATPLNCLLFGFSDSISSQDVEIYEEFRCSYRSEGIEIISGAKLYLDEIQYNSDKINRFNLIAVNKNNIWDDLKDFSYDDFIAEFFNWASLPPTGSFSSIISMLATGDYDIRLVNYVGILADELDGTGTAYIEKDDIFYVGYEKSGIIYSGGHFAISCKTIFRFLEHKYGINFNTGGAFQYNLFTDPFAASIMIPVRELAIIPTPSTFDFNCHSTKNSDSIQYITINKSGSVTSVSVDMTNIPTGTLHMSIQTTSAVGQTGPVVLDEYFTLASNVKTCNFSTTGVNFIRVTSSNTIAEVVLPSKLYYSDSGTFNIAKNKNISTKENVGNFEDLKLYDIVSSYMTIFNVLKSENGSDIKLYRFDDISKLSSVSFPGYFVSKTSKKTSIENISQRNEIKYSSVYETGNAINAGFVAYSLNQSLPKTGEYLTIKGYVPAYRNGTIVLSYGTDGGALKEPCFFVPINTTASKTVKCYFNGAYMSTSLSLQNCSVYSLNGEFELIKKIIQKPCVYKGKFIITPYQYSQISFFNKYFIPQFGCECILLSISGYNPRKQTEPIECTFLKIPN